MVPGPRFPSSGPLLPVYLLWGPGLCHPFQHSLRAHLQPQHLLTPLRTPPQVSLWALDKNSQLPDGRCCWWCSPACGLGGIGGWGKGANYPREGHSLLRRGKLSKTRVVPARPQRGRSEEREREEGLRGSALSEWWMWVGLRLMVQKGEREAVRTNCSRVKVV